MTTQKRSYGSLLTVSTLAAVLVGFGGCSQDVEDIRAEGIQQYRNQQYVESMATLRYGLSIEPSDAQSNYYMGLNYRALAARKFAGGDTPAAGRELDTALIYFEQAIRSWPNYQAAVEAKVEALEARGKYSQALDTADAVAYNNRGGAAEHYIFAGDRYRDTGDYDSALRNYKLALATDPNNPKIHASMGRLYAMAGDRLKAVDAYSRAQQLDPNNPEVAEQLARLGSGGLPPGNTTVDPEQPQP